MTIHRSILTMILIAAASAARAEGPPTTFGRSGRTVSAILAIGKERSVQSVVLWVYGRLWTKPAAVEGNIARIDVPVVRVPTVFQINNAQNAKHTLGELVAFPDQPADWDKDTLLYATAAPKWFSQWAEAVGLPLEKVNIAALKTAGWREPNDKKHLLIIGRHAAGKNFSDTFIIADKHKINVLVLEAAWFGSKSGKVTTQPRQMAGELAAIRRQKWPRPLLFRSHHLPWQGIANRWAWISSMDNLPLVEEVGGPKRSNRVVISYVPWQQQLGRRDVADLTLLNVLSIAASQAERIRWHIPSVLYPPLETLAKTEKQRPVLTPAYKAWILTRPVSPGGVVIDLRGEEAPPVEFRKTLKRFENRNDQKGPLLILGDDQLLDDWKWIGINRKKKTFKRQGATWLPSDMLPPSGKDQIRLMLKLTELGIPLRHLEQETNNEEPNK